MIYVGVLGTGFGESHIDLYRQVEGFEVISVFGRNEDKLKEIGKKYNVATTCEINEVIRNPRIDLIDICLPTELHSQWAIEGLRNGKHVFCETPVTYKPDDAIAIKQASLKNGKNVFVNLFIKFSTPHQLAAEMVRKNEYGRLISIRSYNKTSSRWGDLGLHKNIETFHNHMMDFVIGLAGMPLCVNSSGIDYGDKKSIVASSLEYGNLHALLESNSAMPECCPFEIGFELLCTDGVIRFDAMYGEYTREEFSVVKNGKPREILQIEEKNEYVEVVKHIRDCLRSNTKSEIVDIESAIQTVKLKEMIMESATQKIMRRV